MARSRVNALVSLGFEGSSTPPPLRLLDPMSKLWIVHRNPRVRAALGRATGLLAAQRESGAPVLADFAAAPLPRAVLIGLEGDGRLELDFVHALAGRESGVQILLACTESEGERFARNLGGLRAAPITVGFPPDSLRLRSALRRALAAGPDLRGESGAFGGVEAFDAPGARAAGAGDRPLRHALAERFDAWLGHAVIPGLAGALDPAWRSLPLLVRGRPGSGRTLLLAHAEQERSGSSTPIRVSGETFTTLADLADRLAARGLAALERPGADAAGGAVAGAVARASQTNTVWIDGVDALPAAAQRELADWIRHGWTAEGPVRSGATGARATLQDASRRIRWLATAAPAGLEDRLDLVLAQAFVPLTLEVPPLDRVGGEIGRIADAIAHAWAQEVGRAPSTFAPSAIEALASEPLFLERAELEAILRASLAVASARPIEAADLRFPGEPESAPATDARPESGEALARFLEDLALDRDADPSAALTAQTESLLRAGGTETLPAAASTPASAPDWRRLARSLAHEIRNPLVSIRTFTELLPDHFADETFRARFKELVGKDVAHIQAVVARLLEAAERETLARVPVDVSALIERLLAERRERIGRGRLVVLSELEREQPEAAGDPEALATALAGLIDRALDSLPARGDLFIATRRLARAGDGRPRLRILLRHHDPQASGAGGELDPVNHILEYVLAETIVTGLGGRLTIDPTQGPETLIVIDLPTP